jgi:hypothetical protein
MRTRQRNVRELAPRRFSRPSRKAASSYSYAISDRLDLLNSAHWDSIAEGQSIYLSREYHAALHQERPRFARPRYGLIYDGPDPVAVVVAHVISFPGAENRPRNGSKGIPQLDLIPEGAASRQGRRPNSGRSDSFQLLICGDLFAGGFHGVAVRPDRSLGSMWPAITGLLNRIQRQEGFNSQNDLVLIKDVPSTLDSDTRGLRTHQYQRLEGSVPMEFELPARWTSFQDYLDHLNIRHRMGAYRVSRDVRKAGLTCRRLEDISPWVQRMKDLCLSVQRDTLFGRALLSADLLPSMAQALGGDAYRCTGLFRDEELVSFVFTLRDRDRAHCFCLGWDDVACTGIPILPALLYAVIEDAFALGCQRIDYGRTALKAKAQIGAYPQATELWVQRTSREIPLRLDAALQPLSHSPLPDPIFPLMR